MAGKIIFLLIRVGLGLLFLYAGVTKIWDIHAGIWATPAFYEDIVNYHIITSQDLAMLAAIYLPWLEVFTGAALVIGQGVAGASLIVIKLMAVFTAALASAWWRGLDISCGCFGHAVNHTNFPRHLAGDLLLLFAAVILLWHQVRSCHARDPKPPVSA